MGYKADAAGRWVQGGDMDSDRWAEMARTCGTDKVGLGHQYQFVYPNLLGHLEKEAFVLYEIGIRGGQSLDLWEMWFPHAEIHAFEINELPERSARSQGRANMHRVDATDAESLKSLNLPRPDVVVDDGSHRPEDQAASMGILWPLLRPGGWYVVEDLSTVYRHPFSRGTLTRVASDLMETPRRFRGPEDVCEMRVHHELCALRKTPTGWDFPELTRKKKPPYREPLI